MLDKLPVEVLLLILKFIRTKDLKNLSEVCSVIHNVALPALYESLILRPPQPLSRLGKIDVGPLLRARREPVDLLSHAKSLQITPLYRLIRSAACPHLHQFNTFSSLKSESCTSGDGGVDWFVENVRELLERLKDDSLRSFTWEMATCIPHQLLSASGYLPQRQPKINSLRLITDPSCHFTSPNHRVALTAFKDLTRLSWKGLRTISNFVAVGKCLRQQPQQLEELELNLVYWDDVGRSGFFSRDDADESFICKVFGIQPGLETQVFSSLRSLSLCAVSLTPMEKDLVYALNIPHLRSLKLRFCPGWMELLEQIIDSQRQINLKSLEIQYTRQEPAIGKRWAEDDVGDVIAEFVESFDGLDDLYISYMSTSPIVPEIWGAAQRHKATLRRFILHQRTEDAQGPASGPPKLRDVPDLASSTETSNNDDFVSQTEPFADLGLQCLGICCKPEELNSLIASRSSMSSSLRLLHIRATASDREAYMTWDGKDRWGFLTFDDTDYIEEDLLNNLDINDNEQQSAAPQAAAAPANSPPAPSRPMRATRGNQPEEATLSSLRDFAGWVFGPDGIASLEVLAAGDFGAEGSDPNTCVLLCRNRRADGTPLGGGGGDDEEEEEPFRRLRSGSDEYLSLRAEYSSFLTACPDEGML